MGLGYGYGRGLGLGQGVRSFRLSFDNCLGGARLGRHAHVARVSTVHNSRNSAGADGAFFFCIMVSATGGDTVAVVDGGGGTRGRTYV
jgi:hypothetical protein